MQKPTDWKGMECLGWKSGIKTVRISSPIWLPLLLSATLLTSGCIAPPKRLASPPPPANRSPFWWGTATSSYQNEDRGELPGSPDFFQTDWDLFAEEGRTPKRGEEATFSWTHFEEDLKALKKLGVNHFRFSVEWARVEPCPGVINQKALQRYAEMARRLKMAGIEPIVTLWHLTFPSWLYDRRHRHHANFLHPDVLPAWQAYVRRTVQALDPWVSTYVPMNEPNGSLKLGYVAGHWPPGLLLRPFAYKRAMRAAVTMFRDAARIIREEDPGALVMGVYSLPDWRKSPLQDPTNAVYHAMLHSNFDHLDQVYDQCDIIGVNYYYSQEANILRFLRRDRGEAGSNYTQMGWEIRPEGLHDVLLRVHRRYGKPIVVSENGLGTLSEQKKIRYLREHISQMRRAMADGVVVRGYFPWTLVDNYEWKEGWKVNFGLTSMNPRTRERIIEPSGLWFRDFIRKFPEP